MIKHQGSSQAKKVLVFLVAVLVWMMTEAVFAHAAAPALGGVPKAPGQKAARTAKRQAPKPGAVLTGISPSAAPPGGIGEIVLTGKNFVAGMNLLFECQATVSNLKAESPERAVGRIRVPLEAEEGPCALQLYLPPPAPNKDETGESSGATREVAQVAPAVKFTITKSAPLTVLLGEYTLVPEEEITLMKSVAASGQKMQQTAEASKLSKDQEQNMKKQGDDLKEMQAKYQRGEITQAEFMAAAMKAASGMTAQLTPQQRAAMSQQAAGAAHMGQSSQKLMDLQKQEKRGELRLKQGSLSFQAGESDLFSEPVSGLKDITVVPSPEGRNPDSFQLAFNNGKKYFFRFGHNTEREVNKLKKHLGR